jgi:hypothetical protein
MIMTGGLWLYNNRDEVKSFREKGGFHPATWVLWWSGVDTEELKKQPLPKGFEFDQKASFLPKDFEIDPELLQKLNQPIDFNWNK